MKSRGISSADSSPGVELGRMSGGPTGLQNSFHATGLQPPPGDATL